jgi:hypothetical protein
VLSDRWDQLVFGFYPPELYWRPILALVLFLAAIAPVLYDTLPRKMLYLTAAAPFLCVWLLWGGSIWNPIAVALGFVLGWAVVKFASEPLMGNMTARFSASWCRSSTGSLRPVPSLGLNSILPIGIEAVASRDFGGFLLAFVIGASGIILSMPLGVVLALGGQSDLFIINKFSRRVHRGDPGRAADRVAVHGAAAAGVLPAAGVEFRPDGAGHHHGDAVLLRLHRRGDPRRFGSAPEGSVRGRRQPGPELLAVDAADHPAAGAEDLDPRHRQRPSSACSRTPRWSVFIGLFDPVG